MEVRLLSAGPCHPQAWKATAPHHHVAQLKPLPTTNFHRTRPGTNWFPSSATPHSLNFCRPPDAERLPPDELRTSSARRQEASTTTSHTPDRPDKTQSSPPRQAPEEPPKPTSSTAAPAGQRPPGTASRPLAGATPNACPGRNAARRITESPARGNKPDPHRKSVSPNPPIAAMSVVPSPQTEPHTSPPATQSAPVAWRTWSQSHTLVSDQLLPLHQSHVLPHWSGIIGPTNMRRHSQPRHPDRSLFQN